jgi:hypothetical protein
MYVSPFIGKIHQSWLTVKVLLTVYVSQILYIINFIVTIKKFNLGFDISQEIDQKLPANRNPWCLRITISVSCDLPGIGLILGNAFVGVGYYPSGHRPEQGYSTDLPSISGQTPFPHQADPALGRVGAVGAKMAGNQGKDFKGGFHRVDNIPGGPPGRPRAWAFIIRAADQTQPQAVWG